MGSGGGGQNTSTTQKLAPEQQELLNLALPAVQNITQNTPTLFPGSSIEPFTPLQLQGQQQAVDAAQNVISPLAQSTLEGSQSLQQAAIPAGTTGLNEIIGGLQNAGPARDFLLSGQLLDPASNPVLAAQSEAALRPISQSLTTDVLPNIRSGAVQAGQFGGSRQGIAEGLAIRDFQQQAADVTTNLQANNFNQGLQALLGAVDTSTGAGVAGVETGLSEGARSLFAAPALADLALRPAEVTEGVGSLQQQLQQAQLTEEADRFFQEQILPFLIAQDVASLAFGIPGGTSITQTSVG